MRLLPALLILPLAAQAPDPARLARDTAFLAGPALQGRGNGQPGLEAAAQHLAKT